MKILVLNGSPKREKSDTMHITWAFLEGMRDAAPHEIHVIDVIDPVQFPALLLRYACAAKDAAGPHHAAVLHGHAEGRRPL